jgi:shikimate dehydrogenase
MIRLALFGQPVSQSLSPKIHGLFAQQAGLEVTYEALDTAPGTLAAALQQFADRGGTGCNITLPLKGEAAALAVDRSERVQLANAANTLQHDVQGWHADSTDGPGLLMDLQRLRMETAGKRLAVLGAGGAAASVTASLLDSRPASLTVFNRNLSRAEALAERHAHLGNVTARPLHAVSSSGTFDLVINATSLGHKGDLPPLHAAMFSPQGQCYDMNYGPAARGLEEWCAAQGIMHASGLGMLVGQAAESFRIWTGFRAAMQPVLTALASP